MSIILNHSIEKLEAMISALHPYGFVVASTTMPDMDLNIIPNYAGSRLTITLQVDLWRK